jgi:signal transduction histidine kinase
VFVLAAATLFIHVAVISYIFTSERPSPDSRYLVNIQKYAELLADSIGRPPDRSKALLLAEALSMKIAYEGSGISWSTHEAMPPLADLRVHGHDGKNYGRFRHELFYILDRDEGSLAFLLPTRPGPLASHPKLPLLLIFLTGVLLFSWIILRRVLHPVEKLERAFERVAAGNFNDKLELKYPREFKKAADGFNAMVEKIREMISSRELMLRDVSHELRSPLTRIKLSLQFFPESHERTSIEEDLRDLEKLIDDILLSARLSEAGFAREALDMGSLAQSAVSQFRRLYPEHEIEIRIPSERVIYSGEREGLSRVLQNLLENAAKYADRMEPIRLTIEQRGPAVRIEVSDGGPGIPPDLRNRIFEPFFQVDPSRTPGRSGYGLGLYLSKKVIEEHGGSLTVETGDRGGAAFVITLPIPN